MMRLKKVVSACIIAFALFHAVPIYAATYHVATTGNDTNPGTSSQPWRTVAYAVASMVPGDTTYVQGGTYMEGVIRFSKSGTQTAPIKLLNSPGESPVIDCIDKNQVHRVVIEHASGFKNPMGWITIEGFEIRNCYDGIKFYNTHDLTIRRNWIHDNLFQGILGNGTRILIDSNIINHNGGFEVCATTPSRCNKDQGIYTSGTAFTITNNIIYDNLAYGIQAAGAYGYDPTKHAGPEYARSENWVIANNTIAYQANRAAIVLWGSSLTNMRIENNIFYENGVNLAASAANGVDFVSMTSTEISIKNNISYASGAGATAFLTTGVALAGVNYTQSGNIVNTGSPAFVNAPANLPILPDFKLAAKSPAIDAGLTVSITSIACDGTPRPQGRAYDIGAYEYNPDGDARSPTAPKALRFNDNLSQK